MFNGARNNLVSEILGDSLRLATVSRQSRPEVRSALGTHITAIGTDYMSLRTFVNDFLTSAGVHFFKRHVWRQGIADGRRSTLYWQM